MIVFDKTLLENTFLVAEAKQLKNKNFVSNTVLNTIEKELPILKQQNNLLVRFGFFLLGSFLYSSIVGMFSLFLVGILDSNYEWILFLYALVGFVGSEFLSKINFHNYGLDNAFILGAQMALISAFGVLTASFSVGFAVMTIIGCICCLRYINAFSALMSCVGVTGLISTLIIEIKIIPMLYLPFVLFILAIGLYFFYLKGRNLQSVIYYKSSLQMVQIFSLVLGYFSLNYLVVRELSVELMNMVISENNDIPFAFLFYGFTFIIPIIYIMYALKNKDKIMLYVGFLTLCFSFFTIRYYYSVLPIELALIISGSIVFLLAYWSIKILKNKESGLTFTPDHGNKSHDLSNAELLIINSEIDVNPVAPIEQNMTFGGGGFSGGGASDSF